MNDKRMIGCVGIWIICFCQWGVVASAEPAYFNGHIIRVYRSAQQALQEQSLEGLQLQARKTMNYAAEFQRAAQSANDAGYVSQAVDIYTYAQRAVLSSTLTEAREYIARVESYARFASDQLNLPMHDPDYRPSTNDYDDVSYRNYYDYPVYSETERPVSPQLPDEIRFLEDFDRSEEGLSED